jgi:hypothetical protein
MVDEWLIHQIGFKGIAFGSMNMAVERSDQMGFYVSL